MRHRATTASILVLCALTVAAMTGCPFIFLPGDGTGGGGDGDVSQDILDKETDAFNQVNAERTSLSIDALTMREDLRLVARAHSQDMIDRAFFDHTNPDGEDPFDRMAGAGITYNSAGENIAKNNFADPATQAVDGWMASTGHRENILRTSFTHTGMGIADDGSGMYYFTQVFIGVSKEIPEGFVEVYYYGPIEQIAQ